MVELIDIINATKGKNDSGEPNAGISVAEQVIDVLNHVKTVRERVFTEPEVDIVLNGDYIMFDLTFSNSSAEMRVLWNYLSQFGKRQNECYGKEETPIINFTVLPLQYSGKYFYTLVNPICWTLQPSAPGASVNTIRLLFEKVALNIFEGEAVNQTSIDREIENEEREAARLEDAAVQKDIEHEEYLNRLNSKFNHMQ